MQTFENITGAQLTGPSFVTIGNFDGLHRGHQALLAQVIAVANAAFATGTITAPPHTGLITFDPHPIAVLRPETPHFLLTTPAERVTLAGQQGIDFGVIQQFTHEIAALEARDFVLLLKEQLGLAGLVVGPDFALGRGRKGDLNALRTLGDELGYTLHVVDPFTLSARPVRSSTIREAVQQGDVTTAAELLGRYYHVTGEVIDGDKRGRQIGFPTANIQLTPNKLLPKNGVYATRTAVQIAGAPHIFQSVTNLGVRPTVDGVQQRLETHLLDFPPSGHSGDLYGQVITVEFVACLRDEQRFSTIQELIAQIHVDVEDARLLLQEK